jgi:hypothetical protein
MITKEKLTDENWKEIFSQFGKEVGFENLKQSVIFKDLKIGSKASAIKLQFIKSIPEQQKKLKDFWTCFPDKFWEVKTKTNIDAVYEIEASEILKTFLDENKLDFVTLSGKLENIGVEETNANLSNKIKRGKFSLSFLLQILDSTEKYLILDFTKEARPPISKETFVKHFLELSALYKETDSDDIYGTLDKAKEILLKKAGLTDDVVEHIGSSTIYSDIHYTKSPTEEFMNNFYDEIIKLNEVSKKANDIHLKILKL